MADARQVLCNREVLLGTWREMERKRLRQAAERKAGKDEEEELARDKEGVSDCEAGSIASGDDGRAGDESGAEDGANEDPDLAAKKARHRDAEPGMDADVGGGPGGGDRWAALDPEQRLSAARTAAAARDRVGGGYVDEAGSVRFVGGVQVDVVDAGYWESTNFVDGSQVKRMSDLF